MTFFLFGENSRMALSSIRANKTRSLLTVIGIIIGVASVIMTVSLGIGLREQIIRTNHTSDNQTITVRPGRLANRDERGGIMNINYFASMGTDSLTEQDYKTLKSLKEIQTVVPLATISGLPTNYDGNTYDQSVIVATSADFPKLINQKVVYGSFFKDENSAHNSVVIGRRIAESLFGENVPLGKLITIRGQDFVVGGIFDEFDTNPLSAVTDLNKAIFMSFNTAKSVSNSNPFIYQFIVLPSGSVSQAQASSSIHQALLSNHGGQEDFTVLSTEELEQVAHQTVSIATTFVTAIAAISLLVGGIGIMNIMFVSVTERTKEIGVRKSLGATNQQIYNQFLIEALIVSVFGGILGLVVALIGNFSIRLMTKFQPVLSWQIILLALGMSALVGVVFGTAPAIKASRKDPIESLHYE